MDRRTFIKLTGIATAQASFLSGRQLFAEEAAQEASQTGPVNPFTQEGQWYKAALHAHTTTSDGNVDVPTRLSQYRAAGYQVVAITDHWKTNDLSHFAEADFLPIVGMEFHPRTGTGAPSHHFLALNLPHPFDLDRELPAQKMLDAVLAAGAQAVYAHPYWTAHTLLEMTEVTGYVGLEVFNSVCHLCNKGHSSVHWDQMLNKGKIIWGLATDDVHGNVEFNHGWTMFKSPRLDVASIMQALRTGCFYASSGPTIEDCHIEDGTIRVTTSPVRQVNFFFDGTGGGHVITAESGKTLTTAEWNFGRGRRRYKWIRVEVVDEADNHAWTNPFIIPSA